MQPAAYPGIGARPQVRLAALAAVSGLERDAILELLDEAIEARVVSEVPGAIGRVRFAHALIRDAAYHRLTRIRRVQLHRQAGKALETLYSSDLDSQPFGRSAPSQSPSLRSTPRAGRSASWRACWAASTTPRRTSRTRCE